MDESSEEESDVDDSPPADALSKSIADESASALGIMNSLLGTSPAQPPAATTESESESESESEDGPRDEVSRGLATETDNAMGIMNAILGSPDPRETPASNDVQSQIEKLRAQIAAEKRRAEVEAGLFWPRSATGQDREL